VVVEVATAYAVTKMLLPGRIVLSVWATPWFARVFVGKIGGRIRNMFSRSKKVEATGTGATGAGVVGKSGETGGKV